MIIQGKTLRRAIIAMSVTVSTVIFVIALILYQRKPEIISMSRLVASPGDRLEIRGRFFGKSGADGSKLLIGSQQLTSTNIIEWDNELIQVRVPRNNSSVLVRVKTRSGTSKGRVLTPGSRFPKVVYGSWLPGAPFIEYSEPSSGGPGTKITFRGEGFGDHRFAGNIWVNKTDKNTLLGSDNPNLELYTKVSEIETWTDQLIRFWVPTETRSGNIYLERGGVVSNPVSFEQTKVPGRVELGSETLWSLRQEIVINQIGSFPGNSLYLKIPLASLGMGQFDSLIPGTFMGEETTFIRRDKSLDYYRMNELLTGMEYKISRQLVVPTRSVRVFMETALHADVDQTRPDIQEALASNEWIRPDLVRSLNTQSARNLWEAARIVYDAVLSRLDWRDIPLNGTDYATEKLADSRGYSFLFCSLARASGIPARPVGGVIVDAQEKTREWWWAEFWTEGIGWVPVDPTLGDDVDAVKMPNPPANPSDFYFGGLEGRHIAFSRGIIQASSLQPSSRYKNPRNIYTLQDSWEEVSGNLESYASRWMVPRVTSSYK